jgi:glycerol-3-phosphate dehydrogenase
MTDNQPEPLSAEQHEMRGSWSQQYDPLTHEYPPTPEIAAKVADALLRRIAIAMWDADDAARVADGEADMIMPRDNQQVMSEYLGHASAALAALTGTIDPWTTPVLLLMGFGR